MEDVAGFCVVSERHLDHKFIRSYPSPRGGLVQSSSLPFGPGEPAAGAGQRRSAGRRFEEAQDRLRPRARRAPEFVSGGVSSLSARRLTAFPFAAVPPSHSTPSPAAFRGQTHPMLRCRACIPPRSAPKLTRFRCGDIFAPRGSSLLSIFFIFNYSTASSFEGTVPRFI